MQKSLLVGVDEFTVVLHVNVPVDSRDWMAIANGFLKEFIRKSKIEEMFGELIPMTSKILQGYNRGLTVKDVTWYFAAAMHEYRQEMGVCIHFSAEAWAWYQKKYIEKYNEPMNAAVFYQKIQSKNYTTRISRIDLTADYYNYGESLSPNTIYKTLTDARSAEKVIVVDRNNRAARRKRSHYGSDGVIETIRIGSTKENTQLLCRIYDKKLEQINNKRGFRLDEALACDDWTRFEASYRGNYARQIAEGLLDIKNEVELSQFIAAKITDKFRFYIPNDDDYTEYTNELLDIVNNTSFSALRSENPKNNSLRDSIAHLVKGSGLYPTLYKVGYIWGQNAEIELLTYLYEVYNEAYKQEARKDYKINSWIKDNYSSLQNQKLKDSFV